MTEPKKVAFSSIGTMKKEKKLERRVKSMRIGLTLAESNEKSCPEFNYRELVAQRLHERIGKKSLGDVINGPSLDPSDPFCTDEDAALKALAKKFETKYGTTTPNRKKKRRKENDFSTLGEGYDETDPFIDNSDAFDEVVPTHLETKHRGFYINSGELDFETVPDASSEEETASSESYVQKRQNQISDDEGENDEEMEEREKEEEEGDDDEEVQMKKRKFCENGFIRHKKRKLDEGELLRKRKKMIGQFNAKNQEKKDSDHETDNKPIICSENKEVAQSEENIKASIEAVVIKARQEAVEQKEESEESQSSSSISSSSDSDSSDSSSSTGSDSDEEGGPKEDECVADQEHKATQRNTNENEEKGETDAHSASNDAFHASDTEENMPLPNNLPDDLTQVITRLKEEGHTCKGSSQKFFTDSVNKLLLSIEMKLNKMGGRKKTQIYNYLSQHLPCGTQTIMKRAKNLLGESQETQLQEPLKRLRDAVETSMPPLMERHVLECQKAAESKGEHVITQTDEEENNDGEKKKLKLPKKKFVFTEEIRKLLNDVVHVRVNFWQVIRKRSETPEEYMRLFLDTEVRPIWPKGWMTTRILYKESLEAHSSITDKSCSQSVSVKKPVALGGGTVTISAPQPPKPSLSATVLPKSSPNTPNISNLIAKPKGDQFKRKSISEDYRESLASSGNHLPEEMMVGSSGVLSIKSVEKINEDGPSSDFERDQSLNKSGKQGNEEYVGRDTQKLSSDKVITTASSTVSVIDISNDEEKAVIKKISSSSRSKSASVLGGTKDDKISDRTFGMPTHGTLESAGTKADALPLDSKKEDNLEEEMNLVMNEILQISKKKSVDDSLERTTKDRAEVLESKSHSVSTTSSTFKPHHTYYQSQETYHHHYHPHHSHHTKQESQSSTTSPKQEQSSVSPGKQSLCSLAKQHPSYHSKQESHYSATTEKPEQPSSSPGKQSLSSPVKQSQVVIKSPMISPVKQEQSLPTSKQHNIKHHHSQSETTNSNQVEHQSSKGSSGNHSKHTLKTQEKYSTEHNSRLASQKYTQRQTYADPHHKPLKHHSSKHERHGHSMSLGEHKSPVQTQGQHSLSSLQHQSPSQHTTKQPHHSQQQSHHSQREQQQKQPLNLQQPRQQQSKVQHTSSSYYHSNTTSNTTLSQTSSISPDSSRQKKHSHYPHSQSNSKNNTTNSSWSSSDLPIISKASPTSTSKTQSTWSSSHDVSATRQGQNDSSIVSSSDPLANLRTMHGLSVSSVTKKTSPSTSVYHSPAALATSSIVSYNTSGSEGKKSSSSGATPSSVKASASLPSHGNSSVGLHSTNKNSVDYASSQSKHSLPTHSYSSSSQHTTTPKPRLDPYMASMTQSLYGSMTTEQLNTYKQLQQQQQTDPLTHHQQQELWQQMTSSGFLSGMSTMSSTDMLKLISQMGKSMDSYTSASQHGPGQRHSQF